MPLDLTQYPLVDHHCHSLLDATQQADVERMIRMTSEAPGTYPLADLRETVTFEAIQRIVEQATGQSVTSDDDLRRVFSNIDYADYCHQLFRSRGYDNLFVDTGFSPTPGMSVETLAKTTGTSVQPVLRLEAVAERLRESGKPFDAWWEEFLTIVGNARRDGYIGAKSIIAYRTGLAVQSVPRDVAKVAYNRWSNQSSARLDDANLLHFILWGAAPLLILQGLPLQFHTGYGDPDENLVTGNPLLLRSFIEAFCLQGLSITLLHTYPYHREAGCLASVYPGVYFDISLIIPLGASSARRVLAEALEVAPVTRFLFASDAHTRPEMFALAADLFRDALVAHFSDVTVSRYVGTETVERWCRLILSDNSRALYGGGGRA